MEEVQNSPHKPYMTDLTSTLTIDVTRQANSTSLNVVYKKQNGQININQTINFKKRLNDDEISQIAGYLTGHKQPPNFNKQIHGPINEKAKCDENLHEFTGNDSSTLERVSYEGAFKDFLSCDIPDYPIMKVTNYKKLAKLKYSIKATAKSRLQPLSQSASSTVQPVSNSPSSMLHSLGQSDSRTLEPLSTLPLSQSASSILQPVHKSASSPSSGTEPIIQQKDREFQAQAMIPRGYKWLNKNTKCNVLISESPDKKFLNITYRDVKNNILFSKDVDKKDLIRIQENLVKCQADRKQKSGKRDQETNEKKRKGDTQMDKSFAKAKLNTFCHTGKGIQDAQIVSKRLKSNENDPNLSSNDVTPCASSSSKNDTSCNGVHENSQNEKITLSLADSILQSLDDFFGLDNDNVRSDCNKPVSNRSSRSNECVHSESLLQNDQAIFNESPYDRHFFRQNQQYSEEPEVVQVEPPKLQSVNSPCNVRHQNNSIQPILSTPSRGHESVTLRKSVQNVQSKAKQSQQNSDQAGIVCNEHRTLQSANNPLNPRDHAAPFTQFSIGSILSPDHQNELPLEINDNYSNTAPSYWFHPHGQRYNSVETPMQQVDASMPKEQSVSWFDIPSTKHNDSTKQNGVPYETQSSSSPCMPTADHNVITRQYKAVTAANGQQSSSSPCWQSRQLNYPHWTNLFPYPPGPLVQPSFRQVAHPMPHLPWCRPVHAVPPMAQTQPQSHNMSPYNMY